MKAFAIPKMEVYTMVTKIPVLFLLLSVILLSNEAICYADEEEEVFKAKESICTLIDAGKFAEAKSAAEKMAIEFAGQQKLPEMLYWVAERYERNDQFDKAQLFYRRVIQDYPENQYKDKARLNAAKSEIMALIMAGRYDEAQAALDKYITDFATQLDLPRSLFFIAERYQRVDKFDEAKQIYQRIIENYPNNSYVNRAKLWLSRTNVSSLIASGNYAGAQESLDKLVADFAGSGDLPENLFWITERYERQARFEDARQNYQRIIQNFPYSSWAKRASLGISRAAVIFLVESGDFNKADEAINKMAGDFAKHSDMPWSLYSIAERYKKVNRPADVTRIYQQIVQNHPDSSYASKVKTELGQPQRRETQKQFSAEAEKKAVELYRLARQYEDSNDVALAKQTYQRVINEYPGSIKSDNSVLDIRRLEIMEKLKAGEINKADVLIDKFISNFNRHPYAGNCLGQAAAKLFLMANELNKCGQLKEAQDWYAKDEAIWQRVIDGLSCNPCEAYYYAALCRQGQNKWEKGIEYFQKVVTNWPEYENACRAQAAIGWCYEAMRESGNISKETANPRIEQAYTAVVMNYSNCPVVDTAAYRLAKMMQEKGDIVNTVVYYRKFLEVAGPQDGRIAKVKDTLAKLEKTGQ